MDPCFLVAAGVCFAPFHVDTLSYERHYGAEVHAEYADMAVHLVVNDSVQHFDLARAQTICVDDACIAYHISCDDAGGHQRCLVVFERGREGAASLEVTARSERLPDDWAERFAVLPVGATEPISLTRMQISASPVWPVETRARTRR